MRFSIKVFLVWVFMGLFFLSQGFCREPSKKSDLSMELVQIETTIREIQVLQNKLLKFYILNLLKNKNSNAQTYNFYFSLNKITLNQIKSLEDKKKNLKKLHKETYQNLLFSQLKTQAFVHPLSRQISVNPGHYNFSVFRRTLIYAPISGLVKTIRLTNEGFSLIIENEKCNAYLSGIDEIKINLGQHIVSKEVIGVIEKPKNLKFNLTCAK